MTMTHWAPVRSFGCVVYFEREVPARALLDELVAGLGIEKAAKISTKNYALRWKKLAWKTVDEAIADPATLSIAMMVGEPDDVRLGGTIWIRLDPEFEPEFQAPQRAWFGAESGTWPEPVFTRVARSWLHIAATHGVPLSGGVLAASDLRNAKMELTQELETSPGEAIDHSPTSFTGRLKAERSPKETRDKIRRVYPITLLGPRLAHQVDIAQLEAAGATNVEQVGGSIIFDATPRLIEAWTPEYLGATIELRRLLWPLSFQNPADDPEPRRVAR
jgi:hypothetical protein